MSVPFSLSPEMKKGEEIVGWVVGLFWYVYNVVVTFGNSISKANRTVSN